MLIYGLPGVGLVVVEDDEEAQMKVKEVLAKMKKRLD